MNVIQFAIRYPVTTTVVVILVSLFGLVSLMKQPLSLIHISEPTRPY